MERVIRIQSQQSGDFNNTNNLVDFVIPPAQYNFRDSYLELMATVSSSDGKVHPVQINYQPDGVANNTNVPFVPNSKWVRRCRVRTGKHGIVEEIQDNDILRQNLQLYTKGLRQTKDMAHGTASQVGDVCRNTRNGIFTELRKQYSLPSSYKNTPINVPLSEICEMGQMPVAPVDAMGGLHLNLELNAGDRGVGTVGNWSVVPTIQNLSSDAFSVAGNLLGPDLSNTARTLVRSWGNVADVDGTLINRTGGPVKPGSPSVPITLVSQYADRADCPYFVGQKIGLSGIPVGSLSLAGKYGFISKMTWQETTPLANEPLIDSLTIELTDSTFDDMPAGTSYTSAKVEEDILTLDDQPTFTFRIITANLVLKQIMAPQNVGGAFSYTSWESERFAQTGASRLQQTFQLPGSCVAVMVVFPNSFGYSARSASAHLKSYRLRVNNIDVVNRPVEVAHADTNVAGDGAGVRSGQYFGLVEQFCKQAGLPLRNLTEVAMDVAVLSGRSLDNQLDGRTGLTRNAETAMIAFPVVETEAPKMLEIIADAFTDSIEQVIIYKQVVRSITL